MLYEYFYNCNCSKCRNIFIYLFLTVGLNDVFVFACADDLHRALLHQWTAVAGARRYCFQSMTNMHGHAHRFSTFHEVCSTHTHAFLWFFFRFAFYRRRSRNVYYWEMNTVRTCRIFGQKKPNANRMKKEKNAVYVHSIGTYAHRRRQVNTIILHTAFQRKWYVFTLWEKWRSPVATSAGNYNSIFYLLSPMARITTNSGRLEKKDFWSNEVLIPFGSGQPISRIFLYLKH